MRRVLSVVFVTLLLVSALLLLFPSAPKQMVVVPAGVYYESFKLPTPESTKLFASLWGDGWGIIRSGLTEPASERLQRVYGGVVQDAVRWKFQFRPPELIQTNAMVPLLIPDPPMLFYGRYFAGTNRILIERVWAEKMTDTELRVLLAHELGHAIDWQTERIGHWSFPPVYLFGRQQFADHIARLLVGVDEVRAFNDRYVHSDGTPR